MQYIAGAGLPAVTSVASTGKTPMLRSALIISTMAFLWALGCGGRENGTSSNASTGSSGSGSSGASSGASAGQDASTVTERNPQCPASPSLATGSCKPPLECEYGTDTHHVCATVADCVSAGNGTSGFGWSVLPPAAGCRANTASCPSSFTALAAGSPCPGVTSFCEYPEGLCRCIPCGDEAGISSMWGCGPWAPGGMGCPAERPLSGDVCSVPNQECSYGGYCGVEVGPTMLCQDGYWRQAGQIGSCIIPQCGVPEVDASDGGVDNAPCNGGCLCFSTPETCPSDCAQLHRSDGSFVCGYACDGPGVPCNCVYRPDDGGIYVCDSFTVPACPAVTSGPCDSSQAPCMNCGTSAGPETCGCSDQGPFAGDAGPTWMCVGTEETCKGP